MSTENWISLADYSAKYSVSISTLRRRIKSDTLPVLLKQGKYFVEDLALELPSIQERDERLSNASLSVAPPQRPLDVPSHPEFPELAVDEPAAQEAKPASTTTRSFECQFKSDSLREIKDAFALILKEKEELIVRLREEISDMQTLIKVLESENQRLVAQPLPISGDAKTFGRTDATKQTSSTAGRAAGGAKGLAAARAAKELASTGADTKNIGMEDVLPLEAWLNSL